MPLIIYDPRLEQNKKGRSLSNMALNIDIAPTILAYSGVKIPERMQGRTLLPVMQGNPGIWREYFFYEHLFEHDKIPKSRAVLGSRYKYIRWIDQYPVYEQLFDLKIDPGETNNFAADPDYSHILKKMRKLFAQMKPKNA